MAFGFMGSWGFQPAWDKHVCGLYYNVNINGAHLQKTYLPQVHIEAKATILATTAKVVLKQTFVNPSSEKAVKEVRYVFPLYEGVSVVGFTCDIAERKIVGEVKEKEKARAVYQDAVARGETAGLLEQLPDASDVFTTTIGNIPPGANVIINITYLGELKHDMEVDGIRFTIPNIICPRYGNHPGSLSHSSAVDAMSKSISITVDAQMPEGSFIQKIQSPSHPIAVQIGTTSVAPNAEPAMTRACATLALETAELDKDFILQVIAKDTGIPKAVLEYHPSIPAQRALMATLIPNFALPAEKPEIVFVCDRSGSMGGPRIELAIQALKVFLKSLPVGVKFNICSFGNNHSFLWPRSVTYTQQSLEDAVRHAHTFEANYGGTEMLDPLKATIEQRYKNMPLDVILLTDGEIWNQQALFSYLNQAITKSREPIRIFTLGIGNGVSHALIEGVARAGNGFAQSVGEGEEMNTKVVRMLKGALSPHINDYTLEVKYHASELTDDIDDFEIVEKVTDSLKVKLDLGDETTEETSTIKPISLFNPSADPDKVESQGDDESGMQCFAHLPTLAIPNIIQAPQNIPSLFAFNRTTIYLLFGPDAPRETPVAIVLRGTSKHGRLELEIPISILDTPGETIHQLAAKKAVAELEQGRGWLSQARDEQNALIKSKYQGLFDDMVEREAVRLGVQFQVGGKWTSFVAVESNRTSAKVQEREAEGWEWIEDGIPEQRQGQERFTPQQTHGFMAAQQHQQRTGPTLFGQASNQSNTGNPFGSSNRAFAMAAPPPPSHGYGGALFGASPAALPTPTAIQSFGSSLWRGFGQNSRDMYAHAFQVSRSQQQQQNNVFGSPAPTYGSAPGASLFGSNMDQSKATDPPSTQSAEDLQDYQTRIMLLEQQSKKRLLMSRQEQDDIASPPAASSMPANTPSFDFTAADEDLALDFGDCNATLENFDFDSFLHTDTTTGQSFGFDAPGGQHVPTPSPDSPDSLLHYLIALQTFEGSWAYSPALLKALNANEERVERYFTGRVRTEDVMTALVIAVFEERLAAQKGSWELVVEKAREWLGVVVGEGAVEEMIERGREVTRRE